MHCRVPFKAPQDGISSYLPHSVFPTEPGDAQLFSFLHPRLYKGYTSLLEALSCLFLLNEVPPFSNIQHLQETVPGSSRQSAFLSPLCFQSINGSLNRSAYRLPGLDCLSSPRAALLVRDFSYSRLYPKPLST